MTQSPTNNRFAVPALASPLASGPGSLPTPQPFRVWVRLLGPRFRVRVDGVDNAHWLLDRLTQSSTVRSGEPLVESAGSQICNFCVPCTTALTPARFESLLAAIPEIKLMQEPE